MTRKIAILSIILSFFAMAAAICLSSVIVGAEESQSEQKSHTAVSHLLDGKKFIGPTGEKGKEVHHEDVLNFSDGKFTSSECFQYGFKGGSYTTTIEDDKIHFQAETISPTHGKMVWQGTLKGDTLDVTYNWTKERWFWTTFREYWFRGTVQK